MKFCFKQVYVFVFSKMHWKVTDYMQFGGTVVKVLRYKSEGRWFDPRWCNGIFHWHNPSDRTMALGSTQPLTEMSTRSISWGYLQLVRRAATLPPSCAVVKKSGNRNFLEPSGPLRACNETALPLPCSVIRQGVWELLQKIHRLKRQRFWHKQA
jgi:hypothetical protein